MTDTQVLRIVDGGVITHTRPACRAKTARKFDLARHMDFAVITLLGLSAGIAGAWKIVEALA